MVRFAISTEVELLSSINSTIVAHEILEYLVKPSLWEKHLRFRNVLEQGHTTDKGDHHAIPRYHFRAETLEPGAFFGLRRTQIDVSYIQDPDFPELTFRLRTPNTKYYSKVIRVAECERNNQTYLEVKCDVVIDYKLAMIASCSGAVHQVQMDHEALLTDMKLAMEKEFNQPKKKLL